MIKGISCREDSFLIGFVSYSQSLCAMTMEETHKWIYNLIKKYDDLPSYMYCLPDAQTNKEFDEIIGFSASPNVTEKEVNALIGISYKRGLSTEETEWNISKKSALKALEESPQLEKRFRETFPFIEW